MFRRGFHLQITFVLKVKETTASLLHHKNAYCCFWSSQPVGNGVFPSFHACYNFSCLNNDLSYHVCMICLPYTITIKWVLSVPICSPLFCIIPQGNDIRNKIKGSYCAQKEFRPYHVLVIIQSHVLIWDAMTYCPWTVLPKPMWTEPGHKKCLVRVSKIVKVTVPSVYFVVFEGYPYNSSLILSHADFDH